MRSGMRWAGRGSGVWVVLAVVVCAGLVVSCAAKGQDVKDAEWQAGELCKGFKAYVHGYGQLHKMLHWMEQGQTERAVLHLNRAEQHFARAMEHFQNAEGTKEEAALNRQIAGLIDKGNVELGKAAECLAKGDEGKAGVHCGVAMRHFQEAMNALEP